MGTVYLIHFHNAYKHARHYLGWAENLENRLAHHRKGTGARLMQVIGEAEIDWEVARTWDDCDRNAEAKLKRHKHNVRLCPLCNPEAAHFGRVETSEETE